MDNTFKERLQKEFEELQEKKSKLESFVNSDKINTVTSIQKSLLIVQLDAMSTYSTCLYERLQNL